MLRLAPILSIAGILALPFKTSSQWSTDPTQNLIVGYGLNPELATDSSGGCYITYEQNTGYPRQLILHRLNRYGLKAWGGNGIQILGQLPEQWIAKIIEDGRYGTLISFVDDEVTGTPTSPVVNSRLRVQRVDSVGHFMWDSVGVRVSLSETSQGDQAITSDGKHGCIIVWTDTLNTLRAQRIDSTGTRVWSSNGIFVANNVQQPVLAVTDGYGGIFVSWITPVSSVYKMQRIRANGTIAWDSLGINTPVGSTRLAFSGHGTVFSSGFTGTIQNIQYVAQKIDSSGTFLWPNPYTVLGESTISRFHGYPISVDNAGNPTFAWDKAIGNSSEVLSQRVDSTGQPRFGNGGIRISSTQASHKIVSALSGRQSGNVYVWTDFRTPNGIFAQQLDTLGSSLWDTSDVPVSFPPLSPVQTVSDGKGGFIVVGVGDNFSIRAQQVSRNGKLGEITTSVNGETATSPHEYLLFQNYPNPFNSSTIIRYAIPRQSFVLIEVFNYLGQKVRTLVDRFHEPGFYQINLDAEPLPSGVFFYVLRVPGDVEVRKFTILK